MSPQYASKTTVSVENSRAEIERTLSRYGAEAFAYGWDRRGAQLDQVFAGNDMPALLPGAGA